MLVKNIAVSALILLNSFAANCVTINDTMDIHRCFYPYSIESSIVSLQRDEEIEYEIEVEPVIEESILPYTEYPVPKNSGFKSYMPYTAITSKSSPQYKLQHEQAYTGNYGIRQVDGRYCIAVGSYFTSEIGTNLDLILANGTVIQCILADQKADQHTDANNITTVHNGCVSEFVVDTSSLVSMAKKMGNISYCNEDWNSPVSSIRVY